MVAFKLSLAAIATIIGLGAGTARADLINKLVSSEGICNLHVRWTWNPATVGGDENKADHENANWKVHVEVTGGSVIKVEAHHKSKCHTNPPDPVEDGVPGETFALEKPVPGISANKRVWKASPTPKHPSIPHYDNFKVEFLRNETQSENRIWVIASHDAIDKSVPALGPGGVALFGLILLAGGGVLLKRSHQRGARGTAG